MNWTETYAEHFEARDGEFRLTAWRVGNHGWRWSINYNWEWFVENGTTDFEPDAASAKDKAESFLQTWEAGTNWNRGLI